jgi:hypothetical protein
MKNYKKGFSPLLVVIIIIMVVIIAMWIYSIKLLITPEQDSNVPIQNATSTAATSTQNTAPNTDPVSTTNWKTYNDPELGITFKYPKIAYVSLNTQEPKVFPDKVDDSGCSTRHYGNPVKKQLVSINGRNFCLGSTSDVGAGQLYNEYMYTTFINGTYITIDYVVHTSNGCGAYEAEALVQCQITHSNYDTLVLEPIRQSVATLKSTQ